MVRALRQTDPAIVLVLEGSQLPPELVAELKRESRALWVNWFCDERRTHASHLRPRGGVRCRLRGRQRGGGERGDGRAFRRCATCLRAAIPRSTDPCAPGTSSAPTSSSRAPRPRTASGCSRSWWSSGSRVWGPGWRRTKLRDYCRGELLDHGDYIRAYAGASVAVNVQCSEANDGADPGCNRRLFELAAIGVPQVVEDRPDIHRHFREGSEILVARSTADFKSLLAEALQDRAWSEQVAAGARQRALTEHTYMHRLAALLGAKRVVEPQFA